MNIVGIGTDICECDRIARMIEKHGGDFVSRVFTETEIEYCGSRKAFVQHYSGRWAAKEAILKALGTGWTKGIQWTDMEITNATGGEPVVTLHNRASDVMAERGIQNIMLTISHANHAAVAFAVAVGLG
ncbi:MAG: holo-ACP synthase [Pirellulaceae bacterium]